MVLCVQRCRKKIPTNNFWFLIVFGQSGGGMRISALISFAKTGNPNHPQIPEWPSVKKDDEPTMIFDRECEVRHNFDGKLLQLYLQA